MALSIVIVRFDAEPVNSTVLYAGQRQPASSELDITLTAQLQGIVAIATRNARNLSARPGIAHLSGCQRQCLRRGIRQRDGCEPGDFLQLQVIAAGIFQDEIVTPCPGQGREAVQTFAVLRVTVTGAACAGRPENFNIGNGSRLRQIEACTFTSTEQNRVYAAEPVQCRASQMRRIGQDNRVGAIRRQNIANGAVCSICDAVIVGVGEGGIEACRCGFDTRSVKRLEVQARCVVDTCIGIARSIFMRARC